MSPDVLPINIPGATVKGELLASYDTLSTLDQDILEVDLPNGLTIDVGWYPEYDPAGSFHIRVFREYWDNKIGETVLTREPQQVVAIVERLAGQESNLP